MTQSGLAKAILLEREPMFGHKAMELPKRDLSMIKLLRKTRLQWFLAKKALSFSTEFTDRLYKIYLGHNKVVHFRDGHPVYSLSTPAIYSKPAANMVARTLYRSIQNKNVPNLMSLAVTDVCNAECSFCSFYESVHDPSRKIMSLQQCRKIIADSQELGVSVINFVGGEPLKRPEILQIIGAVDKDLSTTTLFTNGWALPEMAPKLRDAGLDSVYVSIDYADPEKHDESRQVKGLYQRAMKGFENALKSGMSVGLSAFITPEKFYEGELERLVELARKLGVHEVVVFDAFPSGRFEHRGDLIDNNEWKEEMINWSKPYNEDWSYPGLVLHAYAASHRSVGCSCGASYFYVTPYGDICSCDFNHRPFGNALERPLYQIWEEMTSHELYKEAQWGGCKVKNSQFLDKVAPRDSAKVTA